jgi:carbonic anhydrase
MFDLIYRYDPAHPAGRHAPADADEACRRLEEGNRLFASTAITSTDGFRIVPVDLEDIGVTLLGGVPVQQPFAAVLGCSDARAPTELIFDRACNELFVVRVAGNVLGEMPLGSIGYAADTFGSDLKVMMVLGHSGCGAVTAAVDAYLTPIEYLGLASTHQIRRIVDALLPAVRGAARSLSMTWGAGVESEPTYRAALVECSVVVNAALGAYILAESFRAPAAERRVVFGVYDLATRRVHVPVAQDAREPVVGLLTAPATETEFRELAVRVAGSGHVRRLLGR